MFTTYTKITLAVTEQDGDSSVCSPTGDREVDE